MPKNRRRLVDVGLRNFAFPVKVASRRRPEGMPSVATISVHARINQDFEARWISRFIQILHRHRGSIGTESLRTNIIDYLSELDADSVCAELAYPYFVEKMTPVSKQPCLVPHQCVCRAKMSSTRSGPSMRLTVTVPTMTTDPSSNSEQCHGLFAQRTEVAVEVSSPNEIFPEDIVEAVDRHCLVPVYSFLTPEDEEHLIKAAHARCVSSVVLTEAVRSDLTRRGDIEWCSVRSRNSGLLHLHDTEVSAENVPCFPELDIGIGID